MAYLLNTLCVSVGINPDTFDAHFVAIERPFVGIGNSSGGDRVVTCDQVSA